MQSARESKQRKIGQTSRLGAIRFASKLHERSHEPARRLPPPTQQAGSAGSGSASGSGPKEASGGWDSSCLAAASAPGAGPRAPPRTPEQVCLSSAALDALDPAVDLSA